METSLTNHQIISILRQLNFQDRISIFKEFKADWISNILGLQTPKALTIKEYNNKLAEGLTDFENGNTVTHENLLEEIGTWKNQKK